MDENRILHVVDVIRARLDARDIVDTLISLQLRYKPEAVGIEDTQVSKSIGPFLNEEMLAKGIFLNLIKLKHGGKDKVARTRSIQARMRARGVRFDVDSDWFTTFQEECMQFPRAKHDD
jgi:predicted phage terminase large subunit-like protein